jgi:hypothetical protein
MELSDALSFLFPTFCYQFAEASSVAFGQIRGSYIDPWSDVENFDACRIGSVFRNAARDAS